jgi:tRNA-splicing ligase RtcB
MFNMKQIGPATFEIPKKEGMLVPGLIIATEELMQQIDFEKPLQQVCNVAHLPGIVGYSIAMPDIHWGYGFPIGGVAAMDAETGVISPGGVGYDINCGVRLAVVPIRFNQFKPHILEELLRAIFQTVPSGVGHGHRGKPLSDKDYNALLTEGAKWSIRQGKGFPKDLEFMESNGCIDEADPAAVSEQARQRGKDQLGSIGSGNHFVEIGAIEEIFSPEIAKKWNVEKDQLYVLIHSGSRGFGHQVCQDTLNQFIRQGFAQGLPDKQLVAAPIRSPAGTQYFSAMAAAANFAFNNRQQILHSVRQAFKEVLHIPLEEVRLVYDVCHNIAKFETYMVEGKKKKLCVHRKGATRAFGPGAEELNSLYRTTGQPVLVPGDMGRASHLMMGKGNLLTWCSACHGAGRAQSRVKSLAHWKGRDTIAHMAKQGILVMASSKNTVGEEMPDAYKNVDEVVEAVQIAGCADKVARLKPHAVIKG